MATGTTKRGGLADHVYTEVKERLFEGQYGRGTRLPVEDIAAEMDVSRQPVMDAMKRLENEGFVSIVPQVGCMVREYTPEEIHDFYRLFSFGEAVVAELAAEKATTEDLVTLRVISEQIGRINSTSGKQNQARMYRTLNRRLHKEIRRMARSASLTELVESMGDRSDFFIAIAGRPMFGERQRLKAAHAEHEEVLSAIAKRDGRAAADAMMRHILETDSVLQQLMVEPQTGKPARTETASGAAQPAPRRRTEKAA